ncbi:MAG: TRAP transporter small permease subunit [Woeseiaceae bacterium]|nr:TRAP transporter small permease subunit [Woeseiaceae bacterium]
MTEESAEAHSVLDRISIATGRAASWLTLAMVLGTFVVVIFRYAFDTGLLWLQESVTWMHAMVFMLGAAYTLQQEGHVRVDIFYRRMAEGRKAIVNLLGVIVFVVPLCIFFLVECLEYVQISWRIREVSRDAGGLPYPAIPLLKSALLLMPVAILLQSLSLAMRSLAQIRGR